MYRASRSHNQTTRGRSWKLSAGSLAAAVALLAIAGHAYAAASGDSSSHKPKAHEDTAHNRDAPARSIREADASTAAATPTPGQTPQLAEVIVTAEKRAENAQDVPISMQVIGQQSLIVSNAPSLNELSQTLPGVFVGNSGGFSSNMYIRGIGSGGNAAFDQSVAVFDDDIYYGRSRMSSATFLDLANIQVLKGPQSTFFGNNAIAGALNIVTRKPGTTFDASGRLLYGSYGQYSGEAAVTLPVASELSIRMAGVVDGGRGWIKNVNTGHYAPDNNDKAGRITALFKPTDRFDAELKIEGSRSETSGSEGSLPTQWVNCPAPPPIGASVYASCPRAITLNIPMGVNNNENSLVPGVGNSLSTFAATLTAHYDKWGQNFTSVTGFYNYHYSANTDQGQIPISFLNKTQLEKYHQFSEELRVASPADAKLQYLAGIYLQTDGLNESYEINAPYVDVLAPKLGIPAQYLPFAWYPSFKQGENVYSAFGSLAWHLTQKLTLTAGLRGSWDHKNFFGSNQYGMSSQNFGGYTPIPLQYAQRWSIIEGPVGTTNLTRTDHDWIPSAGVQYRLNPQAMAYFTYRAGFKAGGFNGTIPFNTAANLAFKPEHVNDYELGIKSQWLDNRVLLNMDVFRSDYRDLQSNAIVYQPVANDYTQLVRNAAASRSQGVELQAQWLATSEVRFLAYATYLQSIYVSYPDATPATLQTYCISHYVLPYCSAYPQPVPQFANLAGQTTPFAPRWSGSIVARFSRPLPRDFNFTAELSPYFSSSYIYSQPDPYIPGTSAYVRLDGRLSLSSPDGRWTVDVIGKNLTNRVIIAYATIDTLEKEEPRNIAVQVRYQY